MPTAALRVRTADAELTLLGDRSHVVGRAREADVVIRHPGVSRRHLALEPMPDGWLARDLSTNGIWHDGESLDSVRVGTTPVQLRLGGVHGPELTLTVLSGAAFGDPTADQEKTRIAPGTAKPPMPTTERAEISTAEATSSPAPGEHLLRLVPTLVWMFAAAFALGALIALP
jgi:hypothetical protein